MPYLTAKTHFAHVKHSYLFTACISALFALSNAPAYAQADLQPGYLVRPAGDTVRGYVDYRSLSQGAERCVFRVAGEQATTTWLPSQLKGYGLGSGERFSSQLTPMAAPPAPEGSTAPRPGVPARQLFLQVLTDGAASLLNWRDEDMHEHFYVLKAGAAQPVELVQERRQLVENGVIREQIVPVYRGTLTEQFADCPAVLLGISKVEFKTKALVAAVNGYNACRQPGWVAPTTPARTIIGLEAMVGGQVSRTHYTAPTYDVVVPASLMPEIGVGLSLGRRVLRQKFSFRAEVHFVRQVAEVSESQQRYLPVPNRTITQTYDMRFTTAYLRAPLLVRYALPTNKVRPFIEAGISLNYATTLDAQLRLTGTNSSDWQPLIPDQMGSKTAYREYEFGLLAGVGMQFPGALGGHSLAVLARAEQSNGFLLINGYNTSVLRGNVLVSFNIPKN